MHRRASCVKCWIRFPFYQKALEKSHGTPLRVYLTHGTILRGWALAEQGQGEEGISQIRPGLVAYQTTGVEVFRPYFLAQLAEVCGKVGQTEEGLTLLAEALAAVDKNGERFYEAELYRLKGELTLQQFKVQSSKLPIPNP